VRDHQGLRPTSGTAVASVFLQARSVLINPTRCQDLLGAWDWRPNLAFRNGRNGRDPSVRRRFGPHRLEQLADHPTIKNCAMIADAIRVSRTEMTSSWIRVADRVRPLSPRRRRDGAPSQSRSTRNMSMSQCGGGKNGRVNRRGMPTRVLRSWKRQRDELALSIWSTVPTHPVMRALSRRRRGFASAYARREGRGRHAQVK
jgi:hypothetical protein